MSQDLSSVAFLVFLAASTVARCIPASFANRLESRATHSQGVGFSLQSLSLVRHGCENRSVFDTVWDNYSVVQVNATDVRVVFAYLPSPGGQATRA
jgi:hypothetical protein